MVIPVAVKVCPLCGQANFVKSVYAMGNKNDQYWCHFKCGKCGTDEHLSSPRQDIIFLRLTLYP